MFVNVWGQMSKSPPPTMDLYIEVKEEKSPEEILLLLKKISYYKKEWKDEDILCRLREPYYVDAYVKKVETKVAFTKIPETKTIKKQTPVINKIQNTLF